MTRPACNCAGTAPGYPQHEAYCGQEPDEDPAPHWWTPELAARSREGAIAEVMAMLDED